VSCRICGGTLGHPLRVREMMFGTREPFGYHQCERCGCLQIDEIPADIGRHYPEGYYSYDARRQSRAKRLRRGARRRWILSAPRPVAALLGLLSHADAQFHAYRDIGVRPGARLLDVGAGSGAHVLELRDAGVEALGVDPYVRADVEFEGRPLVRKAELSAITGEYDFITFHHSLEHMPQQAAVLAQARLRLAPGGRVLVRVPTVDSEAFDTYRENWVNLDAPRHFYLHSHRSLALAAQKAGLRIERQWCDSGGMQFMGSEQYLKDIPLMDARSAAVSKHGTLFSAAQRREYEARARALNHAMRGDALCVLMAAA
jgi:SAM-dependent methyltransferase